MRLKLVLAAILLSFAGQAAATDLSLNLGLDTAEVTVRQQFNMRQPDDASIGFSLLFNDKEDLVGSAYLQVLGGLQQGVEHLKYGAGFKTYFADIGHPDTAFGAVGIGGILRLDIPRTRVPLAFVLQGYFAPQITSTGRGQGLIDLMARFEMQISRSATAYVGYRYMEVNIENAGDHIVDNDFLIGLRLSF